MITAAILVTLAVGGAYLLYRYNPQTAAASPATWSWPEVGKALAAGTGAGVAVGLGGFFLAQMPHTLGMGSVMFLLVPVAAGFAIALVTPGPGVRIAAALLAVLASLALLIAMGREGALCALLALPFLALGLVIGIALGRLLRPKLLGPRGDKTIAGLIIVLTAPFISVAHLVERPMLNRGRTEVVTNSVRLKASPEQVWPLIASIDNVEAQKSWMMFVGLPVPRRCTVDKPGVGGKRICYFDQGFIEETITEWTPPRSMQLTINRTNMPGRHWLDFEGATYKLHPERGGTIVSRTTMIRSGLYPAFYWRYFERMGVEAEHRYVMEDLVRRAGE